MYINSNLNILHSHIHHLYCMYTYSFHTVNNIVYFVFILQFKFLIIIFMQIANKNCTYIKDFWFWLYYVCTVYYIIVLEHYK